MGVCTDRILIKKGICEVCEALLYYTPPEVCGSKGNYVEWLREATRNGNNRIQVSRRMAAPGNKKRTTASMETIA